MQSPDFSTNFIPDSARQLVQANNYASNRTAANSSLSRSTNSSLFLPSIPMFDRRDHPSVPTCLPRRVVANGGQGWPVGHRVSGAQRPCGPFATTRCLAQYGTAFGCGSVPTSASRHLYNLREAEVASASNSALAVPSKSVLLLTVKSSGWARPPTWTLLAEDNPDPGHRATLASE